MFNLAYDKKLHLAAGYLAFVTGFVWGGWILGVILAAGAGVLKEVRDWHFNKQAAKTGALPPHNVEKMDFVWTAAGAFPGILACQAVPYLFQQFARLLA